MDEVESIAGEEASITLTYTPATLLPEDIQLEPLLTSSYKEEKEELNSPHHQDYYSKSVQIQPAPANSPLLWWGLIGSLSILFISMLIIDAYQTFTYYYISSPLFGHILLSLLILITVLSFLLIWRAYRNLQTLKTVTYLQKRGQQIMEEDQHGQALPYINQIAQLYKQRIDLKTQLDHFYITLNDSHQDREICQLFSNQVLKILDQQAYQLITQKATETTLIVMISQIPLIDGLVMAWRNLQMIQDLANLYGVKPSILNTGKLASGFFKNILYAGVTEIIADTTSELLGNTLLSVFSAQLAQGLSSGILTARLGIHTMQACRPLPFTESEHPQLKDIRQEIVYTLKNFFSPKKEG